jgi:phasin family protein
MLTPEQFAATQKANVETLIGLAGKAFEGVESLVTLNLQTAKSALDDAAETSLAVLSAKDPQTLFTLQAGALQPSAEKASAYGRQVADIAATLKSEIEKVVGASAASAQGSFIELFDAAAKNAPAGSENGIALWKSAVATANNALESLQKAAQQATDVAEANYAAVTKQAVKATQATAKAKRA